MKSILKDTTVGSYVGRLYESLSNYLLLSGNSWDNSYVMMDTRSFLKLHTKKIVCTRITNVFFLLTQEGELAGPSICKKIR